MVVYIMYIPNIFYIVMLIILPVIPNTVDVLYSDHPYISFIWAVTYPTLHKSINSFDSILIFCLYYMVIYYPGLIYMVFFHHKYNRPNFPAKCSYYTFKVIRFILQIYLIVVVIAVFFVSLFSTIAQCFWSFHTYTSVFILMYIFTV